MNPRQVVLIAMLFVLPSSRLWADNVRYGFSSVTICNRGSIAVDVATALLPGYTDKWQMRRWLGVSPGTCSEVLGWLQDRRSGLSFALAKGQPAFIAFAFTDSTGIWGAGKVRLTLGPLGFKWNETYVDGNDDGDSVTESSQQICVDHGANDNYTLTGANPAVKCNEPGMFLFPSAIEYAPRSDSSVTINVNFGPGDRAIPIGPQSSTSGASQGPGTRDDFTHLLASTMNTLPVSEETLGPSGQIQLKPGYRWVFPCAEKSVVTRESLSNLQTARAKALADAIRKFILTHKEGNIRFKVTEPSPGVFVVEQTGGKTGDCVNAGGDEWNFQSRVQ